eukprot:2883188-Rhodomonas_salina.2
MAAPPPPPGAPPPGGRAPARPGRARGSVDSSTSSAGPPASPASKVSIGGAFAWVCALCGGAGVVLVTCCDPHPSRSKRERAQTRKSIFFSPSPHPPYPPTLFLSLTFRECRSLGRAAGRRRYEAAVQARGYGGGGGNRKGSNTPKRHTRLLRDAAC